MYVCIYLRGTLSRNEVVNQVFTTSSSVGRSALKPRESPDLSTDWVGRNHHRDSPRCEIGLAVMPFENDKETTQHRRESFNIA